MAVNVKVKHEFDITFGNGLTQVLSRDEAHQLWVLLNKEFGPYVHKPNVNSNFDQLKRDGHPEQNLPKFY